MDRDNIQKLLAAYALGALDPAEERMVEEYIQAAPEYQQLLAEYEEVAATLPDILADAAALTPPESMREALLEKIATRVDTGERQARAKRAAAARPLRSLFSLNGWFGSQWREEAAGVQRLRLATVILGLLLFFSVVWAIRANVALAQERARRLELTSILEQQEIVLEVVDSEETVRRFLQPVDETAQAYRSYGKVFTRGEIPHVVIMAARLPPPPEGLAYHAWLSANGRQEIVGALEVNEDGFGLLIHDTAAAPPQYDGAGLTLRPVDEPAPGGEFLEWEP